MTDYVSIIEKKLSPRRYRHSLAVADSARKLALQYGADAEKAYFAGLLHDIMKDTAKEEQLCIIEKSGIILTCSEKANPKIWHSIAGAAYMRTELGIEDEDVLNAVRCHTTGRAGMSLLEKVIYTADYISADRTYDGAEEMRRLSVVSLEEAMLFALEFCIVKLAETGQVIHTHSVECYNELIINRKAKANKEM